jgi:hypothetical protein
MNQGTSEQQPKQPLEDPELGPTGARKPHPVDEPVDQNGAGSEPDYFPGKPGSDSPKFGQLSHQGRAWPRRPRLSVGWLQAH